MLRRLQVFLFTTAFLGLSTVSIAAQDLYVRAAQLGLEAQEDNPQAIAQIDALLADATAQTPFDQRLVFDLARHKADLLIDADRLPEAAAVVVQLAALASQNRPVLQANVAALHREAGRLLLQTGEYRAARAQFVALLEEQRDGALSGEVIAQTLEQISDISEKMDRAADAERYRQAAVEALQQDATPTRGDGKGYREVEVFYATDRARTGNSDPSDFYGWGRGDLELGTATITIPDTHVKGLVETPSVWRLEFGPSPAKHVVLQSVTPVADKEFYTQMQDRMSNRRNKELFVFVHGYNVKFDQAAKRAAQVAYDLNYGGLPVLYSWPSAGSTMGYISDTAVVRLSGRRLAGFLEDLVSRSGAETIHILAHSMGNRALTDALELISSRRDVAEDSGFLFDQVLFAAPDVDAGLFAEMVKSIRPVAKRLTLYASNSDWALESSRRLHGNAPRAGQGGEFTLVDSNIDSVDMSELGEDMLAHSYFADDSSALADMMALFWRNTDPANRCGLVPSNGVSKDAPHWVYKRGECESQNLIDIMAMLQRNNVQSQQDVQKMLIRSVDDTEQLSDIVPILLRNFDE
ncbi:MAG: alpha/beta hydrolase [Sulfitobacter sp.]